MKKVVEVLTRSKIEYMITGSFASGLYGEARATHDIDLVAMIKTGDIPKLIDAFPFPEYFLDDVAIEEAIANRGMFNLLHLSEGDKVDFWILTEDTFDLSRFSRKRKIIFKDVEYVVQSPEDVILSKLQWSKLSGGSEKQFTDALRVYEVQQQSLDHEYLIKWVSYLAVDELLKRLREEYGSS